MIYLTSAIHYVLFFVLKFQITSFAFVNVVLKIIGPFDPLIVAILVFALQSGLYQQTRGVRAIGARLLWLAAFALLAGVLNLLVVNPFVFDQPVVWAEWWRPVFNGALPMLVGGLVLVLATRAKTVASARR